MPATTTNSCPKNPFRWGQEYGHRVMDDALSGWDERPLLAAKQRCDEWSYCVKLQYDLDRRLGRVFRWSHRQRTARAEPLSLADEFRECAKKWRSETGHLSSIERKALHPAYQRIIAMGRPAIPLILREMQGHGGHWFWALHFITGESPTPDMASIEEARKAWLSWGKDKGYL
jgi:hypothetical protein